MSKGKNTNTRQIVTAHPSSLKHSNSNIIEQKGLWTKMKRNWPILLATLMSMGWAIFCVFFITKDNIEISTLTIIDLSTLLSGALLPIIMFWLICLVLVRSNPVKESQHSLENGLDQLLSPIDIAQLRVTKIVKNINAEITNIETAAEVASNRFKNLEDNFKEQISELFKATIEADNKSSELKNKLSTEREAISLLSSEIEQNTSKISEHFKQYKEDTLLINNETKKHSDDLSSEIALQNDILESRSKEIEQNLESLASRLHKITDEIADQTSHSYHNLSEIIDGFDERKAVLNNFMTLMMDEVASICDRLEQQATTVGSLSSKSVIDSEKITKSIKEQAEELSTIAGNAINDIINSGKAIEQQAKSMGLSIKEATEYSKNNIAEASDYFAEKANDINKVSNDLEVNIKSSLNEISDIITDKTEAISQDINYHFQTLEADIDKNNNSINDRLVDNIEVLKSLIDQNKYDTENYLNEITRSIETHTGKLEKSLADTRINMIDKTTLLQDEYQSLEKYADSFQQKMSDTEMEIKKQHENTLNCITIIEDGLTVAVEKIKKNSTSLGSHGQKVIENIILQTAELTNQIAEVQNRSKNSILEIQNARTQANDNIFASEKEAEKAIEKWLIIAEDIDQKYTTSMKQVEALVSGLNLLEENSQKALLSSEEKIKRVSGEILNSTDRIHLASTSAIEAAAETNKALDKNSEKYQQMINAIQLSSQSLAANANAIEKKLKNINSENFSKVAKHIMEKLQSESIDISRYLEEDIPQDMWDSYILGDKNIFIRNIKSYIGKKSISLLHNVYKQDTDFKKHVDIFIKTFEELLATFNESKDSVYSETIITSDIGKIYFALTEATGRLKE